jgi:CIC family chloride channel protein
LTQLLRSGAGSVHLLAALVGVVAGLGAIGFEILSGAVVEFVLVWICGYRPVGPAGEAHVFAPTTPRPLWLVGLVLVPAFGGLCSGWLCKRFAPEAVGHGTDAAIDAYHRREGVIRARVPLVKAIASAITLGTGGSGGREGPIAQIGAGFGSVLGQILRLHPSQRRVLLSAGMGAGVGAIFRAPFAGALFAAEILYRQAELEAEVLMPAFISSTVAYCVYCAWLGDFESLFRLGEGYDFHRIAELTPYTLLALLLLPMIAFYTRFLYGTEHMFARVRLPRSALAAIGGLLTGAIAVTFYLASHDSISLSVLGYGYGMLQQTLDGRVGGWWGVEMLLLVAVLKVVTTSLTIGSGGSAGVFGPSMVIGGGVGGAVGIACQQWGLVDNPGTLVIVGMCGFFAGAAKTPVSTIIMVSEMTGSYQLLLPAMWVCGLTFLLSNRWALYSKQVLHRGLSPAHRGEYQVALLEAMSVGEVYVQGPVAPVSPETPLRDILVRFARTHEQCLPVVDPEGRFVGVVLAPEVREYTFETMVQHLTIASDVMMSPPPQVTPQADLHAALEQFELANLDELPVVDIGAPDRLLGILHRRDVARAYARRWKAMRDQMP